MDALDLKALVRLMDNGRATWAELAQHLGLSAPAAAERVHRLEERHVIRGYAALVDPDAVGYSLTAFVAVSLDHPEHRERFLQQVMRLDVVQECHHIAGEDDYLLKVRCHGPRDLEHILTDSLKAIPGVVRTRTTIVLHTEKETTALPIGPTAGGDAEARDP